MNHEFKSKPKSYELSNINKKTPQISRRKYFDLGFDKNITYLIINELSLREKQLFVYAK
jgi:hypothetical protein